jgi:hypothetical protein
MTKTCFRCKQRKDTTEFYSAKRPKDGLTCYCKLCCNERASEYRINHPAKVKENRQRWKQEHPDYGRKAHLRKVHGITVEQYNRMLQDQHGCCKICNHPTTSTLVVDHCHTTGNIRGLLCDDCNLGLGKFRDNVDYLQSAVQYLVNQ